MRADRGMTVRLLVDRESTNRRPGWTFAEQTKDVSAVVAIREFVVHIAAPRSDHRENKTPTLLEQNLIDGGIVRADLVRHVCNIELNRPNATRFEVNEDQTTRSAEQVAGCRSSCSNCSAAARYRIASTALLSVLRSRCRSLSTSAGVSSRFATRRLAAAVRSIKCGASIAMLSHPRMQALKRVCVAGR